MKTFRCSLPRWISSIAKQVNEIHQQAHDAFKDEYRYKEAITGYNEDVDRFRPIEYPQLEKNTYLDHAGTTIYSSSLMQEFAVDMISNLYGNPHSENTSSKATSTHVDATRLAVLNLFGADPEHFDVVFCANATAGIKLVADCFRDLESGFDYKYHVDSHTSLTAVRELARDAECVNSKRVKQWIETAPVSQEKTEQTPMLFAYPAQSNFNGRRLPLSWIQSVRQKYPRSYVMLDIAAFAMTRRLDLSDPATSPDFTVMSFYKVFGFPNLGAVIVKKSSSGILDDRLYYGGGTVGLVSSVGRSFHYLHDKGPLHERFEDGTLPFHSIIALRIALKTHNRLFGSMDRISAHTTALSKTLYNSIRDLKHAEKRPLVVLYTDGDYSDASTQGPTFCFNLNDLNGRYIGYETVLKRAISRNIHLRTGGLCNSGGVQTWLGLDSEKMQEAYDAGHRCGDGTDEIDGKPIGVVRVSFGAMSTMKDVQVFIDFLHEFL